LFIIINLLILILLLGCCGVDSFLNYSLFSFFLSFFLLFFAAFLGTLDYCNYDYYYYYLFLYLTQTIQVSSKRKKFSKMAKNLKVPMQMVQLWLSTLNG
jgi:hypothetical protein